MATSEIDNIRELLKSKPRPVGWDERRHRLDDIGSVWPVADDVKLETVDVSGVPGEWSIAPDSDFSRVLMFFHGGGYCSGSIMSHRRMVTEAGRAAGMRTLAIAYRLAPEHPFPAAYDDALTAWRFLRNEGIPAERIAVGGDSAGAGLAMGLIGRLRDGREELPVSAWLVSPWTDLTMSGSTFASKDAVDPIIHKEYLYELVDAYLPAGLDRKDPRVSPLYADLTGFPPLMIQIGSAETLLDDATRLAKMTGAADVPVTLEIWPHMIHAWPLWNAHLEDGRRALANAGGLFERISRARMQDVAAPRNSYHCKYIKNDKQISGIFSQFDLSRRHYISPRLRNSPKLPPEERSTKSMVNLSRQTSQASSTP